MTRDDFVRYRLTIVDRERGAVVKDGVSVFATSDTAAADALREEYPPERCIWIDCATGKEVEP